MARSRSGGDGGRLIDRRTNELGRPDAGEPGEIGERESVAHQVAVVERPGGGIAGHRPARAPRTETPLRRRRSAAAIRSGRPSRPAELGPKRRPTGADGRRASARDSSHRSSLRRYWAQHSSAIVPVGSRSSNASTASGRASARATASAARRARSGRTRRVRAPKPPRRPERRPRPGRRGARSAVPARAAAMSSRWLTVCSVPEIGEVLPAIPRASPLRVISSTRARWASGSLRGRTRRGIQERVRAIA